MGTKNNTHHTGDMFGDRNQRGGQGEWGEQLTLFATDSETDSSTNGSRYELACERAAEAMERVRECPEMLQAVRAYCEACASTGRRIEVHAAFGYVKNHNYVNHSTGQDFDLNNNHLAFFLRVLAAENPNVAACMRLRASMFDLLDMKPFVKQIQKIR